MHVSVMSMYVSSLLLAPDACWWPATPDARHSGRQGKPRVQRLIFVSAGFTESNRFWTIARPQHLQYDPFLETLLDLDPKTGDTSPAWRRSGKPALI